MNISLDDIDAFVFDFDGVLTNNLVHLDQNGKEWVSCIFLPIILLLKTSIITNCQSTQYVYEIAVWGIAQTVFVFLGILRC